MENKEVKQKLVAEKDFINEMERVGGFEQASYFYETETKLLNHLYKLEKEEAQREARLLIEYMSMYPREIELKGIKNYLIILSSIVARYLQENQLTASKAYAFNATCIEFIETKLLADNPLEIFDEIIGFFIYVLAERKQPSLGHNTVNNVIIHINEDIASAITVEGIAAKFDVSTSHLSRIFREHSGITLVEYINLRKVEESQYYLRFSDKKIADISEQFHFCNQSYFTRIFKKYTGETPRRFRHNISGKYFKFTLPEEESL